MVKWFLGSRPSGHESKVIFGLLILYQPLQSFKEACRNYLDQMVLEMRWSCTRARSSNSGINQSIGFTELVKWRMTSTW